MPNDQRTQFILDAFTKAVTRRSSKEQRLKAGLYIRNQFQNAIRQGLVPTHPRFEWVRRSARTMLELLLGVAQDYDKNSPTGSDRASLADLLDIAQMTQGHVTAIINQAGLDPENVQLLPFEEVKGEITFSPADPADAIKGGEDEEESEGEE